MTLYLQMNGSSDSLITNFGTNTVDKVEMDVLFDNPQPNAYAYILGPTNARINNGTLQFGTGVTGFAFGTRTTMTIDIVSNYGSAQSIVSAFYRGTTGAGFNGYSTKGRIYSVKYYSGGVLKAYYDMSTGTVNDQSGNGNNATLNGGTWLDDGTGGTATNASVTSIISNATASVLSPSISTVNSVSASITSVIANTNTNAIVPIISTSTNISITTNIANVNANTTSPQIDSRTNTTLTIPTSIATVSINNPSINTTRNVNLVSTISNSVADMYIPNVGSSSSAKIVSTIASVVIDGIIPNISPSQNTSINTLSAIVNADTISPIIKTDTTILSIIGNSQADGIFPYINEVKYFQVIPITINIHRKELMVLTIHRKNIIDTKIKRKISIQVNI